MARKVDQVGYHTAETVKEAFAEVRREAKRLQVFLIIFDQRILDCMNALEQVKQDLGLDPEYCRETKKGVAEHMKALMQNLSFLRSERSKGGPSVTSSWQEQDVYEYFLLPAATVLNYIRMRHDIGRYENYGQGGGDAYLRHIKAFINLFADLDYDCLRDYCDLRPLIAHQDVFRGVVKPPKDGE